MSRTEAMMTMQFKFNSQKRNVFALLLLAGAAAMTAPAAVSAQYFGKNKVQYEDFDFKVLKTEHFDFHYYASEAEATSDMGRMAERWYERFARSFQHEFESSKPVIIYADHPDFEQTNVLSGFINEGTGGVTESLKNRVIMPLTGSYWDNEHVLGHELVHAFQYNIAQSGRGGLRGLTTLPLWLIEGMAEYLSVGRDDPLTAMWIRDAIRREDLPTIKQMTREQRYFPYRFGQALWAFVGGTFGDDAVIQVYRRALRTGFEPALRQVLGMSSDTLSVKWREAVEREYLPLMEGRDTPEMAGDLLLAPSTGSGTQNLSPSISPDGNWVAFLSEKDLFSIDLFLADAHTGEVVRKLSSATQDPHTEALRYIDSSGTWSPDSRYFAFVVTAGGSNEMVIVDAENGQEFRRFGFEDIGAVNNPAWSPDGRHIAFSGSKGGISDLYLYDLEVDEIVQLTDDLNADFQPAWSPDGRTIAFTSDRGPETDFEKLSFSRFQIALLDVATHRVRTLPIFGNVKHINPQYAPDGESLYFVSDQDGFSDIYRLNFERGDVRRITRLATAVSGITYVSPAMSVAANTGRIVFSAFDELEFHVVGMDPVEGDDVEILAHAEAQPARKLVPTHPDRFSRVATYLSDVETGLLPSGTYDAVDAPEYDPTLQLDYVGQPSFGVAGDAYGTYVSGGASAYFSDMLGNRILGVAAQALGTVKDIGGQVFYADLADRWNWAVSAGRIPYIFGISGYGQDDVGPYFGFNRYRIFLSSATGQISYPFSSSQRVELAAGVTRYSYDIETDKYYFNQFGQFTDFVRESVPREDIPKPLTLATTSAALVSDNATFGFVSPIQGERYRIAVQQSLGTADFTAVTLDWRKYFHPQRNATIAMRAMHYGRYGLSSTETNRQTDGFGILRPLFIGYETLIRGYAYESFTSQECLDSAGGVRGTATGCPTLDRLFGQRIAVANLELRVPVLGVERYGILNFPFLPTELVFFADGGLAWDDENPATLEFKRTSAERVPLFSTGVSARFNVLGFLIFEAYYAYPWQRPEKGSHWGFQIAPGW